MDRRERIFHLGINAPCHQEDIGISVIIQVHNARSPTDKSCLHAQAGRTVISSKMALPSLRYKDVRVVREMRLEKIQVAVQVEVADPDTHAGLLHPVLVQRDTPLQPLFRERAVVIVAK